MKKSILILAILVSIFVSKQSIAQTKEMDVARDTTSRSANFRNAVNFCPFGVAFGIFVINYEHLITPHQGMVARFDYEMIPKTYSDANIESNGYAFTLNYRYHFSGQMDSFFAGAYVRGQQYAGNGTLESDDFDFKINDFTLGLNVGKRWTWNNGLTATFSLGYGYDFKSRITSLDTEEVNNAIDAFESGYNFVSPFLGELSIGYAF